MNTQPPTEPPRAPYESVFTEGLQYLKDRPILLFGLLFMLVVVVSVFLVPASLEKPLPYVLLAVGVLLVGVDVVVKWRDKTHARETPVAPATELPSPQPAPAELQPSPTQAPPPPVVEPAREHPSPEALRDRYLNTLITECCRARLVSLDPQAADPTRGGLSLEHLYVSLNTLTSVEKEMDKRTKEPQRVLESLGETRETRPLAALEAVARASEGRVVLLGLPGAGKSTFVRYLALRMAQTLRNLALDLADLLPGWQRRPLLPLIVPLGRLAESLPSDAQHGDAGMVERFVCRVLDADENLRGYGEALLAGIRREGGLVLFDGLDEVANLDLRPVVREAVEDFADRYGRNGVTRFLVTCRTYSYNDPRWQLTGWPTHEIAPLDGKKIRQFVEAWHTELSRVDPARADDYARKCQKMLLALDPSDRRRLAEIAPNPLILTVMVVVHTHKGELPDARALVYEECVDLLLVRWETERAVLGQQAQKRSLLDALDVPRITLENALQEIAYRAHEGGSRPGASGGEAQAALVTEDLIAGVLQATFSDLQKVRTFLDYCESANGLLMLQGVAPLPDAPPDAPPRRVYAFPHMTFEEYLAGRYLGRLRNPAARMREHVDRSDRWREPVMLLGEHLCFRTGDFERVDMVLEKLVPDPAPEQPAGEDWRAVWLAGDLLILYRRALQGKPASDERVVARLRALVEAGALTPRERAAAARTLAVLGDPRPGVGVSSPSPRGGGPGRGKERFLPALQWCLVPPGPFLMGSRKEDDPETYSDETPQHTYDVSCSYYIARYPVTNEQFQAFVKDPDGYRDGRWWTRAGLAWREDRTSPAMRGGIYDLPNHPAVTITWYEALAWCRWLARRMQEAGGIPDGWEVRLPTEAEWEKSARGGLEVPSVPLIVNELQPVNLKPATLQPGNQNHLPARRYPWGDGPDPNRANYRDTGIGTTCAVGLFPDGASPYGCQDLSGNVWEWCVTKWVDNYENYGTKEKEDNLNNPEGNARRVVRGGFFYNLRRGVRCACRSRYDPVNLYRDQGFRPVAAPVASEL